MGASLNRLCGVMLPATTLSDIYTATLEVVLSTIVVCNHGATATTFRLAHAAGSDSDAPGQYFVYDAPIQAFQMVPFTIGVCMSAGDTLRAYAGNANLSVVAWGEAGAGGGGGASTFVELLDTPDVYTGQAGKLVLVDPTETGLVFGDVPESGGIPGGSNGQVQYNASGAFAGDDALIWDPTTNRLGINVATPAYGLDVVGGMQSVQTRTGVGLSFPADVEAAVMLKDTVTAAGTDYSIAGLYVSHTFNNANQNSLTYPSMIHCLGVLQGGGHSGLCGLGFSHEIVGSSTIATNVFGFRMYSGTIETGATVERYTGFHMDDPPDTGVTNVHVMRGQVSSGATRWNLYLDGTAQNFLRGNLGVGPGKEQPVYGLDVAGGMQVARTRTGVGTGGSFPAAVEPSSALVDTVTAAGPEVWTAGLYLSHTFNNGGQTSNGYTTLMECDGVFQGGGEGSIYGLTVDIDVLGAGTVANEVEGLIIWPGEQGAGASIESFTGVHVAGIPSGFTAGKTAYGIRSSIPAGTALWNLYMSGSAQNYLAGNLGIGSGKTVPAESIDAAGAIRLGTTANSNNGSIRYTGTDIEGCTGGTWKSLTATAGKALRVGHTWALTGDVSLYTNLPSIFIPEMAGQGAVMVSIRTKLASGTSIGVQVRRNGGNVGSVITVTPTATTTSLGNVALTDLDEIDLVLSSPSGTPTNFTATLIIEHTI